MAKQGGFGAKLKISVSSVLTVIVNVEEVDFPEFENELDDVTSHASAGGWMEYIATGARKAGKITATITWDDVNTTHAAILTAFNSLAPVNMSIEDPGATEVITFSAFITKMARESKIKGAYRCKVEIQPTGAITIA